MSGYTLITLFVCLLGVGQRGEHSGKALTHVVSLKQRFAQIPPVSGECFLFYAECCVCVRTMDARHSDK